MAHTLKEGIQKDIIFGVQVSTKVQENSEKGNRSRRVKKDSQVSLEKDHPKPPSMDVKNLHKNLDVEDPRSLINSILEELPTNKKFRLSPLAARAALASLVSTTQEDNAVDGSKEFGSNVSKKLFMVNDLSSEDPSSSSVEVVTDSVSCEKEVKSSKRARSFEKSSGKKGKQAKVECTTPEVIVSGGTSTTRRTTRSASQKSGGCDVSNDIVKTRSPAEDVPKKSSTARRMTRSTVTEVKEEEFTVKPEMVDVELIQTTKSASSKRNRVKKSIEAQDGAAESLIVSADKKKVQEQSPINVNNSRQSKGDSAKKTPEPKLPVRVTRSALQRGNLNANATDDVQMVSEETQAKGSLKTRRSTRSTNLEEKDPVKKQEELDANMNPAQTDDVQMASEETQAKGTVKTRRSTRSTNLEEREDPVKRHEDLDANMNPAQTEGKVDNRKRSASTTKKQEVHQVVMGLRVTRSKSKS